MRNVSFTEFKDSEGKTDWPAYNVANKLARQQDTDDGVYCYTCGTFLLFAKGTRQQCGQCRNLDAPSELTHDHFVRCPACGAKSAIEDANCSGRNGLYEDGEHEVTCCECDHSYTVNTRVSYSFTSPSRIVPPEVRTRQTRKLRTTPEKSTNKKENSK